MRIHLDTGDGRRLIRGYGPGGLRIEDRIYARSVILRPDGLVDDWRPGHFGELDAATLAELITGSPEIILLGTGATVRFPPPQWLAPFAKAQVGIECMDTGAACRTYNLLASEGRTVAAGLLLEDPPAPPSGPASRLTVIG
ncbi:Mth938-like domain-containing protein [Acidiferrobacter sp.]|uniref:Mth938-like domain-containing protein n=1 Tax=Acidiferrobacter sp. TaxID=1872107 RepID=UPI00261151A1|nr:Mth938-like domain-containing protein [Acidiferrobacter sp.]